MDRIINKFKRSSFGFFRYLSFLLQLFAVASLLPYGQPGDYDVPGEVSFREEAVVGLSTFQSTGPKTRGGAYYSRALPSLMVPELRTITWSYWPDNEPREFIYPHTGGELTSYPRPEDEMEKLRGRLVADWFKQNSPPEYKGIAGLDKNFVRLNWDRPVDNTNFGKDTSPEEIMAWCLDRQVDYLIYGSYEADGPEFLRLYIRLYSLRRQKVYEINKRVPSRFLARDMPKIIDPLREVLAGQPLVPFRVFTDPPKALVYLDDNFMGLAPLALENIYVSRGRHRVRVEKEGYRGKSFLINVTDKAVYRASLEPLEAAGRIRVTTKPSGARVYLGINYAGTTPLVIREVPPGIYRVRVSMDNMVDRFRSVKLKSSSVEQKVDLEMFPGDTKEYYRTDRNLFWGLDYYDLSLGSLGMGTLSLGGVLYFLVKRDRAEDELRSKVPTRERDFDDEDDALVEKYTEKYNSYENKSRAMQAVTAGFVGLATYFFIQYLRQSDVEIARDFGRALGGKQLAGRDSKQTGAAIQGALTARSPHREIYLQNGMPDAGREGRFDLVMRYQF